MSARVVLLGLLLCAGCRRISLSRLDGAKSSKAAYVRDPSHHCVDVSQAWLAQNERMVGDDGKVKTYYGWRNWKCDDNVSVVIGNDEEQP